MTVKRHKNNTKTFEELTFSEQAKSINATINQIQSAMLYHINHSSEKEKTRDKCLLQTTRLLNRLIEKTGSN